MLAPLFLALACTIPLASAQANGSYTVWSSVVFLRSGDRTPLYLGSEPPTLTSLGAQQLYSVGQFFRSRYLNDPSTNTTPTAPIVGLNTYSLDDAQTYVATLDKQYTVTSVQAFMQGFYPPYALNNTFSNAINQLADGTKVSLTIGSLKRSDG